MLRHKHLLVFVIVLMAALYLPDIKVWTAAIITLFCLWFLGCLKSFSSVFAIACALVIIIHNANNPYGRLEKSVERPFPAKLYITNTTDKGTFTQATAKILNRDNEKVLVKIHNAKAVKSGDVLEVPDFEIFCVAKQVNEKTDYYDRYLKSIGIRYIAYLEKDDFRITEREYGFFFVRYARNFNEYVKHLSDKVFTNRRTNAFIKGLLIGDKESFTEEELESFSLAGTSHIIAVSGFHIMVFLTMFTYLTMRMNKKLRDCIILLFVFFLIFVTGCSPSVVRAGTVVTVYTFMSYIGIDRDIDAILPLIAAVFIFLNPYIIYNASFLLSFSAAYSIVKCNFLFQRVFSFLPKFIGESLSATLSAQTGVLPAMLYCFNYVTVFSVITNILVTLLVPFLFVIAPISMATGNKIFIFMCDIIVEIILSVSERTALIDYNAVFVNYDAFSLFLITLSIFFLVNLAERIYAGYELKMEVEYEKSEDGYQE